MVQKLSSGRARSSAIGALAWLVVGCGGSITSASPLDASTPGAPTPDAASSTPTDAAAGDDACDAYFTALYLRCGGPRLPDAEVTRLRARFAQVCGNELALPGSGITPVTLGACASALAASACDLPLGEPPACAFHGSLAGGATCTDSAQCASDACVGSTNAPPPGGIVEISCGTCAPEAAVGGVCESTGASPGCAAGGLCLTNDPSVSPATSSCAALTDVEDGGACNELTALCHPGLYCAAGRCHPLEAAGATCGEGATSRNWAGGCVAPLGCFGPIGAYTCASSAPGGSCESDDDCAPGLGCQSGTCGVVTWVSSGQPCSESARCLVGTCSFGSPMLPHLGDGGAGQCPTVIADGLPCSSGDGNATCDTFAQCFGGACVLTDGVVCK